MFHLSLFLLVILISCYSVAPGVWVGISRDVCYGKDFTIPLGEVGIPEMSFIPRNLFFSPKKGGGEKIQVMENGTTLDSHYEISSQKFIVREATERDAGDFSFTLCDISFGALRLSISDCSSTEWERYGADSALKVPREAYSLVYSPNKYSTGNASSPVLLWNRTDGDPQAGEGGGGGRGRLEGRRWKVEKVTPRDNGYYTFRDKDRRFISRVEMRVEEQRWTQYRAEGEDVQIITPGMDAAWFDLTFTPTVSHLPVVLMKAGEMQMDAIEFTNFAGRIEKTEGPPLQIRVRDLQASDSGRFRLTDQKGNLALTLWLEVEERGPPYGLYVGVPVAIVSAVVLAGVSWCCVKKCCKKTARKTLDETPADVCYHDDTTEPSTAAHPSSSHDPVYPALPLVEASPASHDPAAPTAPLGFHPSAPPLSSPPPHDAAYTSDRTNFL